MEEGGLNPLYALINCPWCTELVEFGEDQCDLCSAEFTSEFWTAAEADEILSIQIPLSFPWDTADAYNERTLAERNCSDCVFSGTNACAPIMDWLWEQFHGEVIPELDSIHPCNSYTIRTPQD